MNENPPAFRCAMVGDAGGNCEVVMDIVQQHTNRVDAILALSRHFPVIPTHSPENGGCSCRKKAQCSDPGKHPRTRYGLKDATRDEAEIREGVHKYPNMNVAIPTGSRYRLLVIDLDGTLGLDSRFELERKYSPLPETVSVKTGRGEHFYYRINNPIKSRIGILPGLDIKADGGMVVAPGSVHANGRRYEWINSPDDMPIADAPEWLIEILCDPKPTVAPKIDSIPKGKRNDSLFKLGCSFRAKGFGEAEIFSSLRDMPCEPPLPDTEIRKIAKSASQYEPSKVVSLPIKAADTKSQSIRWVKMPIRAMYDYRLCGSENYIPILGIICGHVIKDFGYATITQRYIHELLNSKRPENPICLQTVKRAVAVLKKCGYLRVHVRKESTPNGYKNRTFIEVLYGDEIKVVGDTQGVQSG